LAHAGPGWPTLFEFFYGILLSRLFSVATIGYHSELMPTSVVPLARIFQDIKAPFGMNEEKKAS
jgi:hypothetical protein